jgi:transcriptional regulator with XRE-family HTH domain
MLKTGILSFMRRKHISQKSLAKIFSCTDAMVSCIVSGKNKPSYDKLKILLEMGATVEELFGVEYNRVAVAKESDLDFKRRVALALRELAAELRV